MKVEPKDSSTMSREVSTLNVDDMKTLLNYKVSATDTEALRKKYRDELSTGKVDLETKFQYAWCMTHSQSYEDWKLASSLFTEIFQEGSEELKRDSLFYLTVAETKQKNYATAKKYIKAFLEVEENNVQAQQLSEYIEKNLKKDGLTGMAIFSAAAVFGGAAAVAVGTLVATGALTMLFKRRK